MSDIYLTKAELDAMPAKTQKHAHIMELYLKHDFETAYALHTDDRVEVGGYRGAVGAEKDWERHGSLQRDFLISQGLKPKHMFLEIGCGTGRLVRKLVPYLNKGNYYGVDLSSSAIYAAVKLASEEGWSRKEPNLYEGNVVDQEFFEDTFDFAWAFSVFIHCPYEIMERDLRAVAKALSSDGRFLFSWCDEKKYVRSGLKQFRHTRQMYEDACSAAGLTFREVKEWTGEQRIAEAVCK